MRFSRAERVSTMITLLGQMATHDLSNFLAVFATYGNSQRSCQIYSIAEDARRAVLLFEWESLEEWHEFLEDAQVSQALGTKPRPQFTILKSIGEFQSFGHNGRASRLVTPHRDFVATGTSLENLISARILEGVENLEHHPLSPALKVEGVERETSPIARKIHALVGI